MTILDLDTGDVSDGSPVDILETIAVANGWGFDREEEDEISMEAGGEWASYELTFTWLQQTESLHVACAFDLKIPEAKMAEVTKLLILINEQMWIGHFDIWQDDGLVLFRNVHLLSGGATINLAQAEALRLSAIDSCELYFQAFQFVVWGGQKAKDAIQQVMFHTDGEA